jgi:hypothetical protein
MYAASWVGTEDDEDASADPDPDPEARAGPVEGDGKKEGLKWYREMASRSLASLFRAARAAWRESLVAG